MKSYIKYTVLMLGFALVIPVLGFFWGDKLMMGAAQRSLETGDISEAMNYYDRMEKIFPKSSKIPESKLYKAGIFLQRDSQPGSRVFRFTDGNTYRNYDLDYPLQQALYTLEQIDASSPAWVKAYVPWLKARTFYELGLMDRALDLLREVAFNTPEASWPLTTWVRIQIDRGKSLEAIAAVDRFFESIGSSSMGMKADLWELKGDAYLALGRLDEALRAYQEARTLAPKQFAWLTGQRFIKILRPNLAKERHETQISGKISAVTALADPSTADDKKLGISGRVMKDGQPVKGTKVYIASQGSDLLFSGEEPAADMCYTDAQGHFFLPKAMEKPIFGVGIPPELSRDYSLALKVEDTEKGQIYGINLVPSMTVEAKMEEDSLGGGQALISVTWDRVAGAKSYELFLIPPEKGQRSISLGSFPATGSEESENIEQVLSLDKIASLKPYPLLRGDISAYHILGPLYPDAQSFVGVRALDEGSMQITDDLGFLTKQDILAKRVINLDEGIAPYIGGSFFAEGDVYVSKGEHLKAVAAYEKQFRANPKDQVILEKLVRLHLWAPMVSDVAKAQDYLERWENISGERPSRLFSEICFISKRSDEALPLLERLSKDDALDAAGYQILSQIYLENGDYKRSVKAFTKAVELWDEKIRDFSPLVALSLELDFEGAASLAQDLVYDGQRFLPLLDKVQKNTYPADVTDDFKSMLIPLTVFPEKGAQAKFDQEYMHFTKSYPKHQELADLAFKLAFGRFN